jgi:hypothetical protein
MAPSTRSVDLVLVLNLLGFSSAVMLLLSDGAGGVILQ